MNYWDEVKRIQVSMRSASIYTQEATEIINGITGKLGYLFTVNSIYKAVPIEEIRRMIITLKEKGGQHAEMAAQMEAVYQKYPDGSFIPGEKMTEAEIADSKDTLETLIHQLRLKLPDT
ncbi:MAG: hypothetical protein LBD55_05045 [Treponema sp.]|jgi:hypothetical protein|nr:hypothetical protein [Treponema sp.]